MRRAALAITIALVVSLGVIATPAMAQDITPLLGTTSTTSSTSTAATAATETAATETAATYTVTFETNGGTVIDPATIEVSGGEKLVLPENPTKEGYDFGGWFTDFRGTIAFDADEPVTESLTLYAKWLPKEDVIPDGQGVISGVVTKPDGSPATGITVTINSDGGGVAAEAVTDSDGAWSVTLSYGAYLVGYAVPEGYALPHSMASISVSEQDREASMELNLIAQAQTFIVTFDYQNRSHPWRVEVEAGQKVAQPDDPSTARWDGKVFDKWTLNGEAYDFSSPVTADITLVAQWKEPLASTGAEIWSAMLIGTLLAGAGITLAALAHRNHPSI